MLVCDVLTTLFGYKACAFQWMNADDYMDWMMMMLLKMMPVVAADER